jgi:hypothetical protein
MPSPGNPTAGVLTLLPPPGSSELAIATHIADQIKHAMTIAAAHPEASFDPHSYAALAQRFLKAKPARQAKAKVKAETLLRADPSIRQRLFGRFASSGPEVHDKAGLLDTEILVKQTVALS